MSTPKVQAICLYADDVRSEANGKLVIIGMYGDTIILNSASPEPLPLVSLLRIFGHRTVDISKLRVEYLIDHKEFYAFVVDFPDGTPDAIKHQADMERIASFDRDGEAVEDVLLVHGYGRIIVPITKEFSLLSVRVHMAGGVYAGGSLAVQWIKSEDDEVTSQSKAPASRKAAPQTRKRSQQTST